MQDFGFSLSLLRPTLGLNYWQNGAVATAAQRLRRCAFACTGICRCVLPSTHTLFDQLFSIPFIQCGRIAHLVCCLDCSLNL